MQEKGSYIEFTEKHLEDLIKQGFTQVYSYSVVGNEMDSDYNSIIFITPTREENIEKLKSPIQPRINEKIWDIIGDKEELYEIVMGVSGVKFFYIKS